MTIKLLLSRQGDENVSEFALCTFDRGLVRLDWGKAVFRGALHFGRRKNGKWDFDCVHASRCRGGN
jgi:hypothetical protein